MIRPLTLALAIAFTASVQADTDCNVKLREGKLERLEMPQEVERKLIKPNMEVAEPKAMPAKDGHQYAVLTVKLAGGKSIGLYDYALKEENGTEKFNVVGMSISGGPFQRSVWEVRAGGDTKVSWVGIHQDDQKEFRKGSENVDADAVVKLLFEVPAGSKRFKLVSRLLDKNLEKEYGVKTVLDFDDMSTATPPKEEEKPAEPEETPEN